MEVRLPFGVPDIFLADSAASSGIDPGILCALAVSATGSARARGHLPRYAQSVKQQAAIPEFFGASAPKKAKNTPN